MTRARMLLAALASLSICAASGCATPIEIPLGDAGPTPGRDGAMGARDATSASGNDAGWERYDASPPSYDALPSPYDEGGPRPDGWLGDALLGDAAAADAFGDALLGDAAATDGTSLGDAAASD